MNEATIATRALEVATKALTRVDAHEKTSSERYKEISSGQISIFNKIDQLQRNNFWMWLTVAGATIGILLTVVGYLLTKQGVV